MPNLEEVVDLTGPPVLGRVAKACPPPLPGMSDEIGEEEAPEPHSRLRPGMEFMGRIVPGPPAGRRTARRKKRVNYNIYRKGIA